MSKSFEETMKYAVGLSKGLAPFGIGVGLEDVGKLLIRHEEPAGGG